MPKIYSMLSNDRSFPKYVPGDKKGKVTRRRYDSSILIKGGANVADKNHNTNGFVENTVTAEDLKALEENASYKRLVARGFLSDKKPTTGKKDKAAPKTEDELKAASGKKGVDVKLNTDQDE